ncbi:MAG: lipopolysaccharide heptosyltransferase II [Rickettsiales bacterium]|nr:lipopolysaccharide heptosyltransferase II [Rickettsiales bacterium]
MLPQPVYQRVDFRSSDIKRAVILVALLKTYYSSYILTEFKFLSLLYEQSMSVIKVLVIGPSWVGDMVMAQSLIINLKNKYKNSIIDVLVPQWASGVVERMPEVRQVITHSFKHKELSLYKRYTLGKNLRKYGYDQAYVLPKTIKSAIPAFAAKIPERIGYLGEHRYGLLNKIRTFDPTRLNQTVKRHAALAFDDKENLYFPRPKLKSNISNQKSLLKKYSLRAGKVRIGLVPGAEYGEAKQWPLEYHSKLATLCISNNMDVVIFGSPKEIHKANKVQEENPLAINTCGRTTVEDAVDLIDAMDVVVANDSGLMHVASALSASVVAIYGSTSPSYTPPLSNDSSIIYKNLNCSPCNKKTCPLVHHNCMKSISPEEVFLKINELLNKRSSYVFSVTD